MAAQDDQKQKQGSPDPRPAFTQEQWAQRIAPANKTAEPVSAEDHPLIQKVNERISELTGKDRQVMQTSLGQSSSEARDVYDRTIRHFERKEWDRFLLSHPDLAQQYKDYEPVAKALERRSREKADGEYTRAIDQQYKDIERERIKAWEQRNPGNVANQHSTSAPSSTKPQGSPEFVGNVNVGVQQSKFNEFNARTVTLQHDLKTKQVTTPPTAPSPSRPAPKPLKPPPPQATNKFKAAAGIGAGGLIGLGKIVTDATKKGVRDSFEAQQGQGTSDLAFFKPGHDRWKVLLDEYQSLNLHLVITLEGFRVWLEKNPGLSHPVLRKLLSTDDWKDKLAYDNYKRKYEEQLKKEQQKKNQEPKKSMAPEEHYYRPPQFFLEEDDEDVDEEDAESPASERQSSSSSENSDSASPSREGGGGNDERPSPKKMRRRIPRPRMPGRGMIPKIPGLRGFGGGAKIAARLVVLIGPWGWAAIGVVILIIIVVVILKPSDPSDESYSGEVAVETQDTNVENPDDESSAKNAASSQVASAQTQNKKAVLAISAEDLQDLINKSAERADEFETRIKEFMDRYIKSLITYKITARYDGPAYEITTRYPIPENAIFVKASGIYDQETIIDNNGRKRTVAVSWKFTKNNGVIASTSSAAPGNVQAGINFNKYTQAPYFLPSPQSGGDSLSDSTIAALNRLGNAVSQNSSYLQSKFFAKYVDPFLSVIWVGAIEGVGDRPYFWNCKDSIYDINAGCPGGYYSGGWQVGYGVQVAQVGGHLADDFDSIYGPGSSGNATRVKEVGQAVISDSGGKITNPSTFPSETIPSLVSKAGSGNQAAQQAIAILLLDQKLGATAIALEVAGDISARDNWAGTMRGWGSYYSNNMQSFSNRAKAIADKYSGQGGGDGGTGSGQVFGPKSFTVTVIPKTPNSYVQSTKATMTVDEVEGTAPSDKSATESGMTAGDMGDGRHAPPTTNTCGKYSLFSNPAGKNYGDPTCNYDKNRLFDLLKKLDPANANLWFNKVIPCESAYDPNTFYRSGAQGDTPDPYGAWGLFQMGRGVNGPFTDLTKGSTNNPSLPEDRGDVNWEMQVSNAVNFNKKYLSSKGRPMGDYWACAR